MNITQKIERELNKLYTLNIPLNEMLNVIMKKI